MNLTRPKPLTQLYVDLESCVYATTNIETATSSEEAVRLFSLWIPDDAYQTRAEVVRKKGVEGVAEG